jgi:hypothetical protein
MKILVSLLCLLSMSLASASDYTIKKGDTLSKIALLSFGNPVYGRKGSLAKVLKMNPHIKNMHRIWSGQHLNLEIEEDVQRSVVTTHDYSSEILAGYPKSNRPGTMKSSQTVKSSYDYFIYAVDAQTDSDIRDTRNVPPGGHCFRPCSEDNPEAFLLRSLRLQSPQRDARFRSFG